MHWKDIHWKQLDQAVRKMQAEIVKAARAGNQRGVIYWQDKLTRSREARLLAVRQVTTNNGKHTSGVDGVVWKTPQDKMQAAESLTFRNYKPGPARRVMVPKSDGKRLRPIGILTMYDRAMQALYLFALDPIAETRADPHSYGFRKYRSTADAIMACREIFADKSGPKWVLEADIEECFDTIDHEWLLTHIPLYKPILRGWLKAGYMDKGKFHKTTRGLPQGGIISPVLANMALDGMEEMLITYFHRSPEFQKHSKVALVRYADDLIAAGAVKKMLDKDVKVLLANFLEERGMKFSARKTKLTHITKGFDFLGCHLQAQTGLFGGYRLIISPTQKNYQSVIESLTRITKKKNLTEDQLVGRMNQVLRGWINHYAYLNNQKVFARLDHDVFELLIKWAKRRYPHRLKRGLKKTYFTRIKEVPPVFTTQQGQRILRAQDFLGKEAAPIDPNCNPYDPRWEKYLARR